VIKTGATYRSKFTESPTRDNPDVGQYSNHLIPFGKGLRNPMTARAKYQLKANNNPPPGHYDIYSAYKHIKPRTRTIVIKNEKKYAVYD